MAILDKKPLATGEQGPTITLTDADVALLDKIKPSIWDEMKTEAIDFSKRLLWLDDDLWEDELKTLEKYDATENLILINLSKDPEQLKKIIDLL